MKTLIIFFLFIISAAAQTGSLSGRITDSETKEPLPGANIIVLELDNVGTASDENGKFNLDIPVGSYSIKCSIIGYTPVVKTDVIIKTKGEFFVDVQMAPSALEMGEVTVSADYFDKAIIENNLSTVALSAEEVKRSPGSMMDFQRILQAMSGVSYSNDQTNELLVRGGSPNENLTVFDGMELHSTNHYPNEYNSGGPINMINTDLIQDMQFSTGGFISKYGDKLSSVMQIETREGTRNSPFMGEANMSMAGVGTILEGGIGDRGSWVFSARKSYLEWIVGSVGLTSVPKYYDLQYKVAYDLSSKHKISFSGIYGNDRIDIEGETDKTYASKAGITDSVEVERIDVKQNQWAHGLNLKSVWSDKFFSQFTIYANNYHNNVGVVNEFTERKFNSSGKVDQTRVLSERTIYNNRADNTEAALKSSFIWNINDWNKLEFGGQVKFGAYTQNAFADGDTVRFDTNGDGLFDVTAARPIADVSYDYGLFDNNKSYAFFNDNMKFFDGRLIMNLGLRYDYFNYPKQGNVSPRISLSYYLIPAITSLNLSYGRFYQTHAYPFYGDRYQSGVNRNLENSKAIHYVAGIEHIFSPGLKLTVEGYYKDYSRLPISEEFINYNDRTFRSVKFLNVGEMDVYGIDLLLQQKLVEDIYGTLAFSRMWTEVKDPRIGYEGNSYVSDYDFPYVFTLIVGKRFKDLRSELNDMPFFIRYPSYILPFSDDMELSVRWRFASGRPFTERIFTTGEQSRVGENSWTDGTWVSSSEINGERYPDYHRLDIGMISRYNFDSWNLVVTLSIQNLYNRKNIAAYQYNSDGTIDNIYQFEILPVLGLEFEF